MFSVQGYIVLISLVKLISFTAMMIISQTVFAIPNITVAVNMIAGLTDPASKSAPYNQILSNVESRLSNSYSVNIQYYPAVRAATQFERERIDCLFPSSKVAHDTDFKILESTPVNVAKAYFLSKQKYTSTRILDTNLPPLTIVFRRGYIFGGKLKQLSHHTLLEMNSDEQALQFMLKGRADIMIAYMPDFGLIDQSDIAIPSNSDQSTHFYSQNDSIICRSNEQTAGFLQAANKIIQELHDVGTISNILGESYLYNKP